MAHIFPVYFSMQAALPAVLALTYPGSRNPFGVAGGVAGVLDRSNRWTVLAPLASALLCAVGNLAVVGPRTTRVMDERRQQGMCSYAPRLGDGVCARVCVLIWLTIGTATVTERKDGKKAYDAPPHSQEMQTLNRRFSMLHGISSLLNLGTLVATIVYGVTLSSRLA